MLVARPALPRLTATDHHVDRGRQAGRGSPLASSIERTRYEVVVLPSVPVMPTTPRWVLGKSLSHAAASASAGREAWTRQLRHGHARDRALRDHGNGAGWQPPATAKSCPSACCPGTATNSVRRPHPPRIERHDRRPAIAAGEPRSRAQARAGAIPAPRAGRSAPPSGRVRAHRIAGAPSARSQTAAPGRSPVTRGVDAAARRAPRRAGPGDQRRRAAAGSSTRSKAPT